MRLNIKPASTGMYHHSYDTSTIASMDLGQLVPIKTFEVVERDEFSRFSGRSIMRLAPQQFPAYGKLYYKAAAFFVPDFQIMAYASSLRSNMSTYKGKAIGTPHIHHSEVAYMFYMTAQTQYPLCTIVSHTSDPTVAANRPLDSAYDFTYVISGPGSPASADFYFCKFTTAGRLYYKILKGLGIDMPTFSYALHYSDAYASANTPINIIALLSYAKVYCDYFMNSHFYNSHPLVALLHSIHDMESYVNGGITWFDSQLFELTASGLYYILSQIRVPHEQNMYTTAWNSPNSPTGLSPQNEMNVINGDGVVSPYRPDTGFSTYSEQLRFRSDADLTGMNTRHSSSSAAIMNTLSDLGLRYLRSISDFVRRNNLFGSRAVERLLSRFGIKNDDYLSNYAHKLYEGQDRIDFSAVMSNTDSISSSGGKTLGSYAGFGVGSLNIDFNYKSSSNGFIVVLSWIQEVPIWIRGTKPFNLRNHSLDWYTPEFDGQSIRAIPLMELSQNKRSNELYSSSTDKTVFGFTDLYDDYRYDTDTVLGDFVLDEDSVRNFFFGRDLSYLRYVSTLKPQTNVVQYYSHIDFGDLTNPFQFANTLADRFYLSVDWDIECQRVVRSKSDALMLNGSGDLDMPQGGHLID